MTYRDDAPSLRAERERLRALRALRAIARAASGPTISLRHSGTATPPAALWALAFVRRVPATDGARS